MNIKGVLRNNTAFTLWAVSAVFLGLFVDYIAIAFSLVLTVTAFVLLIKDGNLVIRRNFVSAFVLILPAAYLLSCLWAVDSGVALFGFARFASPLLFLIICCTTKNTGDSVINKLPYLTAIITVITSILMQFQALESYFSVAGRLAGTFQYSNTFAILCLISLIVLLTDSELHIKEALTTLVLVFGIFYSGSRAVFALTGLTLIVLFFRMKSKKAKAWFAISLFIAISVFVLYSVIADKGEILTRFTRFSLSESTLVGRILYWRDAIPMVIKRPFGMGYMGYYFAQGSFKTGLYSVMYVHNDFLQILLDVGWIPFAILLVSIIKTMLSKSVSFKRKFALVIFSIHILFDFDLQFVSMLILFILLLDWETGEELNIKRKSIACVILGVLFALNSYLSLETFLQHEGKNSKALAVYPYNTFANIELLLDSDNASALSSTADDILRQNKYVSIAYDAKAKYYYSTGDFENVINNKKLAIQYNYYDIEEYIDFCNMLIVAIDLYSENGDRYSAEYCKKELLRVPAYISSAKDKMSKQGKQIKDQPRLVLPDEINAFISSIE